VKDQVEEGFSSLIEGYFQNKMIVLKDIVKTYSMGKVEVPALRGIDLEIKGGEFATIMGPSGSGKSTLLNIIGCLDRPTSGSYTFEGVSVEKFSDDQLARIRNLKIGFVFQNFNLLSRISAQRNAELPLIYSGVSSRERDNQSRKALVAVGLEHRVSHRPGELSGGEQQRVAIARALINQPSIILADEPTGNLDSQAAGEIMDIFRKLNQSGITILLVTHEADIAAYARRIIRLRDGKVVSDAYR